jgi:flagellar motor component MotA
MTELLQIENKLSEILDELKKMNERFKYSSDPDTKRILKELKEMNARAREEEYKKNYNSDPNRE